jgi:hypothetical protein
MLINERTGEYICPEIVSSFTKRNLQLDLLWLIAISAKESECMAKDGRATLNTVVQPACTMLLLI